MDYMQYNQKPFQVISKLGVRYTGIFDHISQEDQTICLSQVYNHGTEDRPSSKKLPGSNTSLGWVRFHTESIESLALVETHLPPGVEEQPVDPILASISKTAPGAVPPPAAYASGSAQPAAPRYSQLPPRPPPSTANTALDRVQASLSDLSLQGQPPQSQGQGFARPRRQPYAPKAAPIEVPDTPFDFTKGTNALQADRVVRREKGKERDADIVDDGSEADFEGSPEKAPHPLAIQSQSPPMNAPRKNSGSTYTKSSFFDNLSGESSRVSRAEERGRNFDTFGEAGGATTGGPMRGGGGRGRGGYYNNGPQGGHGRGGGYRNQGQYGNGDGNGYGQGQRQDGYRGRGRGRGYSRGGGGGGGGGGHE